jgi:hypothetical protein
MRGSVINRNNVQLINICSNLKDTFSKTRTTHSLTVGGNLRKMGSLHKVGGLEKMS